MPLGQSTPAWNWSVTFWGAGEYCNGEPPEVDDELGSNTDRIVTSFASDLRSQAISSTESRVQTLAMMRDPARLLLKRMVPL